MRIVTCDKCGSNMPLSDRGEYRAVYTATDVYIAIDGQKKRVDLCSVCAPKLLGAVEAWCRGDAVDTLYADLRALVRGCHDYSGDNRSNAVLAAFHAGIDTVTHVVDAWVEAKRSGKNDTQIDALLVVGREALKKEGGA